jgi:branched-chain amino acid transport system ATP-binding protein
MTTLNGVSAHIRRGAVTTLVGPNGAGKSTLFKAIFGLLPVRSGAILFDGRDIYPAGPQHLPGAERAPQPRTRRLRPFGQVGTRRPGGGDAAAVSGARRESRPAGVDLSGGQQKLLEVARGLLLDPRLILIDEPSIGLSPVMVQEVFSILTSLRNSGVTIMLIEQNARQALQMSDDGVVLEQGQARIKDTAASILADPRIARLFLGGGLAAYAP